MSRGALQDWTGEHQMSEEETVQHEQETVAKICLLINYQKCIVFKIDKRSGFKGPSAVTSTSLLNKICLWC